jgi:enoyl-CoA hydratase
LIEVEQRGHISVLHMTHGKANALNVEFCEAITVRLEEHRHASTQALVLTGRGEIFSAGVDLLRLLGRWSRLPDKFPAGLAYGF